MSVKVVSKKVYECRCELVDCPSKGAPWLSKALRIPPRCRTCHRYSWNGKDLRTKDGRSLNVGEPEPKKRAKKANA